MSVIYDAVKWWMLERPMRGKTGEQIAEILDKSGRKIWEQMQSVPESETNHRIITHVIGIERWSQRRIRVAEGEPFNDEEYTTYRPPRDTPCNRLKMIK